MLVCTPSGQGEKRKYRLTVDWREMQALEGVLGGCGD